jgi:electron transfer flavoprotein beta subunit
MKILVCVKQSADVPRYVEFTGDGKGVDPAFLSRGTSEADAYALEEALVLKERHSEAEVVVLTAGDEDAEEVLRQSLAKGADRAIRVSLPLAALHDPIATARALAAAARDEAPDMVLCGVQSTDAAQQATGPALASALGMPCISVVTKVAVDSGSLMVQREFEGGLREIVEVATPALLTIQTGLNTPRYGSFKGMMMAKKKEIPVVDAAASAASRTILKRLFVPGAGDGRKAEMIEGGPKQIASRILELVQEARA